MERTAVTTSRAVLGVVFGPTRRGVCLGHGYIDLGDYVLALVRPGAPRMPNGIECDVAVTPGQTVTVGRGHLEVGDTRLLPGPLWEPVPRVRVRPPASRGPAPDPLALAGRGEGLTPAGDDVLIGYAAGLVLFHGRRAEARGIAETAAPLTTALSVTLLRHAAEGELPEPAHALLELGDAEPLLRFGHSSGRAILAGLAVAAAES